MKLTATEQGLLIPKELLGESQELMKCNAPSIILIFGILALA